MRVQMYLQKIGQYYAFKKVKNSTGHRRSKFYKGIIEKNVQQFAQKL